MSQTTQATRARVPKPDEDQQHAGPATFRTVPGELVTAWVLSLLAGQASYGYELHRHLEEHGVNTKISALYRTLRRLEDEGCVASSWVRSAAGPRRRLYRITTKGRQVLDALVQAITATRDAHAAFLDAHRAARF